MTLFSFNLLHFFVITPQCITTWHFILYWSLRQYKLKFIIVNTISIYLCFFPECWHKMKNSRKQDIWIELPCFMESTSALILDDSYPRADILNKIPLWRSRIKQKKKRKTSTIPMLISKCTYRIGHHPVQQGSRPLRESTSLTPKNLSLG